MEQQGSQSDCQTVRHAAHAPAPVGEVVNPYLHRRSQIRRLVFRHSKAVMGLLLSALSNPPFVSQLYPRPKDIPVLATSGAWQDRAADRHGPSPKTPWLRYPPQSADQKRACIAHQQPDQSPHDLPDLRVHWLKPPHSVSLSRASQDPRHTFHSVTGGQHERANVAGPNANKEPGAPA